MRDTDNPEVDALDQLIETLPEFEFDPLGFVLWAYPWGEPGTELESEDGPEDWQRAVLSRIGDGLRAGGDAGAIVQEAVAAGHGVGKSTLVSWLIDWSLSTHPKTRGVVTANTDTQLRTKTWAELAKWHNMSLTRDLFNLTATAIYSADATATKTWRVDAIPWSKDRPESFAGMHNKGRRILLIFDEASAIDDIIWETAEGALTDANTQIVWCAFGNPTRTAGRFFEAMAAEKGKARWHQTKVDSRTVRFSNKKLIEAWKEEYGDDSDFFRVRVRGEFPRVGASNFISPDIVTAARRREVSRADYEGRPKIISVDVAEFGDNKSVVTVRQGFKVIEMHKMSGADAPQLVQMVTDIWAKHHDAQAVVIDAIGVGGPVAQYLERVPGMPVMRCNVSLPMLADSRTFNLRAEIWWRMREWLENAEIPDDDELARELTSIEYGYDNRMRVQLESKKDMRRLGRPSPDSADSLALSFFPETIQRVSVVTAKVRPVSQRKVIWTRTA